MVRGLLRFLNGLLNVFAVLVLIVLAAYSGFALWDNNQIYDTAENVQKDLMQFKPKSEEKLTEYSEYSADPLSEIKAINEDVCAWLNIDNTMIDYPVLQGKTNSVYLNRDVYGEYALAGSIFLDSRCMANFESQYNLVHGHNMSRRRMFGDILLFKDADFFEQNRTGTLILEKGSYLLRTFACMVVSSGDDIIFNPEKWALDIEEPLEYAKENALNKDVEMIDRLIQENEVAEPELMHPQIIVMATCSSEYSDARTVLLAEMIEVQLEVEKEEEI